MNTVKFSFIVTSLLYESEDTKKTELYVSTYDFPPEDFTMDSLISINDKFIKVSSYIEAKRPSVINVGIIIEENDINDEYVEFNKDELENTKKILGHPISLSSLKEDCMKVVEYVIKNKRLVKEQ